MSTNPDAKLLGVVASMKGDLLAEIDLCKGLSRLVVAMEVHSGRIAASLPPLKEECSALKNELDDLRSSFLATTYEVSQLLAEGIMELVAKFQRAGRLHQLSGQAALEETRRGQEQAAGMVRLSIHDVRGQAAGARATLEALRTDGVQQIGAMEKLFARTAEAIIGAVRKSETDMIRGNMCKYLDHQERMNGVRVFAGDWHAITQGCTQTLRKFVEEHTTQLIESFGVAQRGVAAMGKCIQEAELSSTTALGALEQAKDKNDELKCSIIQYQKIVKDLHDDVFSLTVDNEGLKMQLQTSSKCKAAPSNKMTAGPISSNSLKIGCSNQSIAALPVQSASVSASSEGSMLFFSESVSDSSKSSQQSMDQSPTGPTGPLKQRVGASNSPSIALKASTSPQVSMTQEPNCPLSRRLLVGGIDACASGGDVEARISQPQQHAFMGRLVSKEFYVERRKIRFVGKIVEVSVRFKSGPDIFRVVYEDGEEEWNEIDSIEELLMPDGLERDLRELRSGMLVAYWNGESPGSRYRFELGSVTLVGGKTVSVANMTRCIDLSGKRCTYSEPCPGAEETVLPLSREAIVTFFLRSDMIKGKRIPDETVRKLTLAGAIGKVSWKKRRIV